MNRTFKKVNMHRMPSSLKKFWRRKYYSFSSIPVPTKPLSSLELLEKMQRHKIRKLCKLYTGERHKSEKEPLKPVHEKLPIKRLNGHRYKEFLRLTALQAKASVNETLERKEEVSQEDAEVAQAYGSNEVHERDVEISTFCSEGQRRDCNLTREVSLCNGEAKKDLYDQSSSVDGVDLEIRHMMDLMDGNAYDDECLKPQTGIKNESLCAICLHGGHLLCCKGQGCKKSFHLSCVDPPLTFTPPGIWHCSWCTRKKIEFGVHSVSEGIESILARREAISNYKRMRKQKEFLVKYKSLAHVHNRWIPETQLRLEAPVLFERYKHRGIKTKWKAEWSLPHRLIKRRLLIFPEGCHGYNGKDSDCDSEWLVKWRGLTYDHATWELANASFLMTPQAILLRRNFESRQQSLNTSVHPSTEHQGQKINPVPVQLSEFPCELSPGIHKCQLPYVNKLREYWSKHRNAVVFAEDRIVKVVLFILSSQCNTTQPFLIITSSSTISLWEAEFSRCSSSANIVVYNGNKDVRDLIRSLEFFDEGFCVSFRVLLSPPDVIAEDLEMLNRIRWEAMVIDECQRPVISVHLMQIKMLVAEMKLLLFSGQVADRKFNYHNVLAFLDPEFDDMNEDVEMDPNIHTHELKERLAQYTAFGCQFDSSELSEYWVPVHLSRMQIEQCRDLLLSNSRLLCSSLKNDGGSLRDILILTKKCCDHPYLVDPSLRSSATKGLPSKELLDAEINVSGKLQLLDKMLSEVKKRGLKVLVLFQSIVVSGEISIGDILDDLVHRRFGEDCYARIQGELSPHRRQAALDMFNNKEGMSFICLMDYRSCIPSVKLWYVDLVILFNSDLNPLNDLRALQRITINSKFQQLKVFRLYSSFTMEEKALIFAKQGTALDSHSINRSSCHMLLSWGAAYLFNKVTSSGKFSLNDVLSELWPQLPSTPSGDVSSNCSIILHVEQMLGTYPKSLSLHGEVEAHSSKVLDNEAPHLFWQSLLGEGTHLNCKHSSRLRRVYRKAQTSDASQNCLETTEFENVENRCEKVINTRVSNFKSRNKRKLLADVNGTKITGEALFSVGKRFKQFHNPKLATKASSDPRVHRKAQISDACSEGSESGNIENRHQKVVNSTISHARLRNKLKLLADAKASKITGVTGHLVGERSKCLPFPNSTMDILSGQCGPRIVSMPSLGKDHMSNEYVTGIEQHERAMQVLNNTSASMVHPETVIGQESSFHSHQHLPTNGPAGDCGDPTLDGSTVLSNVQPTLPLPSETSTYLHVCGSESDASHLRNMNTEPDYSPLLSVKAELPQSGSMDPLQREMEKIQNDKEQAMKTHQEMKSIFDFECEKEIAEIRKKYDAMIQESEMQLGKQMEMLESKYKIVSDNKMLADALAQKCDLRASAISEGTQQVTISSFMEELLQLYFQPSMLNSQMVDPPATLAAQLLNHSSGTQSTHGTSTSSMVSFAIPNVAETLLTTPPMEIVNLTPRTAPIISPIGARSLPIPTIHSFGNSLAGHTLRAPAPHLRNPRTLYSVSLPNFPTSHPMPSINESANTPSFSLSLPPQASPVPSGMQSGDLASLPVSSCPPSAPELLNYISKPPPLDLPNLFSLQQLESNHRAI